MSRIGLSTFMRYNPWSHQTREHSCLGVGCNAQSCDFRPPSMLDGFTTHAESPSVMNTPRLLGVGPVPAFFGHLQGPGNVGSLERRISAYFEPFPELRPSAAKLSHLMHLFRARTQRDNSKKDLYQTLRLRNHLRKVVSFYCMWTLIQAVGYSI
ncbi:uncharacterized protein EI90DRAFT_962321 [Cantharellus anzutake]|uniref:uncharacterized protein n=1 Tax=Cantharellus anzutake TaxID=1750568 RepID=UPI001907F8B1|nr:uncharacterized protein EI90DRAFT_962321 [Cantharellus anzutake]KAF8331708.1 hypothetical protein EI90DRAFT_962321 [Cantharellus anzutake]